MDTSSRLVMLGAAPETRGSIGTVVDAYRTHGLFKRWPIEYVPTHCEGGRAPNVRLAATALRRLIAALLEHRRIALHVHTEAGALWRDAALMAPALAARCPVILQLHGAGFETYYDRADGAARALARWLLEHAACVIVPCESLRGWVRSTARAAHVVCLAAPVVCDPVAKDPGHPNLVLFLGRLAPDKGIFDLLEALAALRASVPDVRLVCAGDGNRVAVARHAERLGMADAVKFTGWVGPSGKRALFESAAVLAAPCYDAALPVSVVEAMAAGVPVVASAVGGIAEAIVDGVTGFLIAPGDSASLARKLRRVLTERELAARIGAAGRESVRLRAAPALPKLEEIYAAIGVRALAEPAPAREADLRKAA